MVPVEIRPGHIRFLPRGKDPAMPENQFPVVCLTFLRNIYNFGCV
ncbi:hypothetical protein A2U01_0009350 [Trifolium medium]|uniref:Uncharacterized protein n=2 Tax=Trifolium medium TaxID=97028 RepID=A0A392MM58_9FABA|nr:hypothetical protein [Trifolium medium]